MAEPHTNEDRDAEAEDISRLWERVVPMFSLLEGQLERTLTHRHKLGLGQLMALGVLVDEQSGSATVSGVARRLGLSVSAASRILAHLERSGWTGRVAWPCDRRASRVAITEAGLAVWRHATETLDRELDHAFTALKYDERYAHVAARLCRAREEPPAP
ncbi:MULTISPECIES: MarR family winged helix-turn-helix transcriptional regulator [unclassified Streptomyces]|uniref:MarR family winged helix-turn-helix transcriptional regulator n=1 Tax=unclassified Streptomyces TaxID=2593676 RepID=UPI001F034FAE|nr:MULTISPECIES: MarR family transcriptional regulator [unclassified Streptomyces]MCH0566242.1 MarR family transcriptional regulator [Streptomyces sp. MUM 2J]MCH0568409.1 MarR family transcriptional regulator [Streptomyces sp. MUM 136J]